MIGMCGGGGGGGEGAAGIVCDGVSLFGLPCAADLLSQLFCCSSSDIMKYQRQLYLLCPSCRTCVAYASFLCVRYVVILIIPTEYNI